MINYDSINEISALLKERGLVPRKRWGQNFLVSKGARQKLLALIDPKEAHHVWEIGPGLGSLTALVLPKVKSMTLFEIDHGYYLLLDELFGKTPGLRILEGDFLKTWKKEMSLHGIPDIILGNLPYNAGSVMLGNIVKEGAVPGRCIFTLQKEVVQRIAAEPGKKTYSAFSMICQYVFSVRVHGTLAPGSFYPCPQVTSAIVELYPHHRYKDSGTGPIYFKLVHDLFASRRKTIRNNLISGSLAREYGKDLVFQVLQDTGIDPALRGETVPVDMAVQFAERLMSSV